MPVKGVKQGPIVVEKDVVEIRGVELKGQWNRMFEPRVIDDYDLTYLDEVSSLDGGESIDYCYQCGKCVPVCPVDIVGNYGPRKIYRKLQLGVNLVEDPDLWLCTTCMNCLRVCPKEVNLIKIMPAVREVAVNQNKVPSELQKAFENTARYGNPLGENPRKRAEWAKEAGVPVPLMAQIKRPVENLWYVSSYTSYHPRGKDAARAMARVFTALGVDWGILGPEEKDDGDSQRLAGEKGLFEMLAEQNIATFGKYQFAKLVVSGPHEFNAFKNIYPKYGGTFNVEHYTQFLRPFIPRLKGMMKKPLNVKVTFHDPCYLGRHNGEYDAPRELLKAIPGVELTEMGRCRENGYCCGGGGGGMWTDSFSRDYTKMRLSDRRVLEAVETGAEVLAVCCPFEVSRFEDAVKATGNAGKLVVRDIIEMVDEAMKG
jgi:Fe-S oxidoreductase